MGLQVPGNDGAWVYSMECRMCLSVWEEIEEKGLWVALG